MLMLNKALAMTLAGGAVLLPSAQARGQSFTEMVAMRDDVHLATDVYLPTTGASWPTILMRTPYDKDGLASAGSGFASLGIAAVIQDLRGRFDSEGLDMVFTTEGDGPLKDGYDTIAWIVEQPWCNGRIGTTGGSALGVVQYMQSSAAPPGLVVINAAVATPNLYQDAAFWGGVFRNSLIVNWLESQGSLHFLAEIAAHPYEDDFWASAQTADQYGVVSVPGLHEGGWYDIFVQGTIDAYRGYQHEGGTGARGNQKLILGPWTHGTMYGTESGELTYPTGAATPPYTAAFDVMFNHYLEFDSPVITDTPDDIPNVQYYVMGDVDDPTAPGNEWRTAADWPPEAAPVRLHLQPDGSLAESCPPVDGAVTSYSFDPDNPSPTICGTNLTIPAGSCDQRPIEARSDTIVFSTPVLTDPVEVTGRVRAHLLVDIDQLDADVMVRMTDVYPDGRSMLIADGARRLATRGSTTALTLLSPGEVVEASVDLWSTSIIVAAGHRLRISITSSNWPRYAVNLNNGQDYPASVASSGGTGLPVTVNVHHSAQHASYLEVPNPTRPAEDYVDCGGHGGGAGSGGSAGTGGSGASAGTGPGAEASPSGDESGCGCRLPTDATSNWRGLVLIGLVCLLRRRRG